jgi:aarF domain-containing kinase
MQSSWQHKDTFLVSYRQSDEAISHALANIGVRTEKDDITIRAEMARGMFDTSGTVDPFADDSPMKDCAITDFPRQFFLVLRVVQLLRGLSSHMRVQFSSAQQWKPIALKALQRGQSGMPVHARGPELSS